MSNILNKKFKTIGVLGGMGAAASADFYTQLVKIAQEKYKAEADDDFPPIWIYNLPVTGFNETGFVDPESVKNQMINANKNLAFAGSDFIVIPCNTAHYFYKEMQAAVAVPILSILEVTLKAVKDSGFTKVGLINSQSTKIFNLYEKTFQKNHIETISTTDEEQTKVNKVISNVISGLQGKSDIEQLKIIINRYKQNNIQAIVLGCTELPLAFSQKDCVLPLFNTTKLLADAALRHSYNII
jgi:aspartate racemase